MKEDFKVAYKAGRDAYRESSTNTPTLKWVVPCAAIVVAAVARFFSMSWYTTAALELALVVVPAVVYASIPQHGQRSGQ